MARGPDFLDAVTGAVAATIGAAGYASYKGHTVPALATLAALFSAAYVSAPRRKYPTAAAVCPDDVAGKVALVTGATSGIGIDTAGALYQKGAKVYIAARNPKKLEAAVETIKASYDSKTKGELHILVCDLGDLVSVKECVEKFLKTNGKLDILINNAGIMALPERTPTKQGLESQVGVCHVGHFLLTTKLMPTFTKDTRVVCLTSSGHRLHKMNEMLEQADKGKPLETVPYDSWVAYGNAKCSNLLFAKGLHQRGICLAYSVMPGGIHTGLQTHVDWWTMFKWTIVTPFFFKSTEQGAATSIVCATTADPKHSGQYYDNCKPTEAVAKIDEEVGEDAAEKLWKQTEDVLKRLGF